jgi:hypothetical protein
MIGNIFDRLIILVSEKPFQLLLRNFLGIPKTLPETEPSKVSSSYDFFQKLL